MNIFKNNRALLKSSLWLLLLRCIGLVQSFITIKVYFNFLDTSLFAFLIVLFSYQIVFSFFDLGLSNAIINKGVKYHIDGNRKKLSALFIGSITFLFFWSIFSIIILITFLKLGFLNDYIFPGVQDRAFVIKMFILCCVFSMLRCCFAIVNSFRLVFNQTYFNGIFDSAALVLSIIGQLVAVYLKLDFTWHIVMIFGVPVLGHIGNLISFLIKNPYFLYSVKSNIKAFFLGDIKLVLTDGAKFFLLQLASTFAYNSIPIILSLYTKTEEIAIYGILVRIFNPISSLITVFLQPQWSFLSQSYLKKEYDIIKKSYRFSLYFVLIACFSYFFALFLFKDFISEKLLNGGKIFPIEIMLLFTFWIIVSNIGGVFAVILNALNALSYQLVFSVVVVLLFSIEIMFFVPQYGLTAVLIFISLNVIVTGILPSYIKTKQLLHA